MARPKSEDKRNAIMAAATRVIATEGLDAPTAMIAKEAGVANGSLFTYFDTKADLFNTLYVELKTEISAAALDGLPTKADLHDQVFHVWSKWMAISVAEPDKRRALMQLHVCDDITAATRETAKSAMKPVAELLERSRAKGPLRNASLEFVLAMMNSLAEATIDFMIHDPANAKKHCKLGFDAFWRVLD